MRKREAVCQMDGCLQAGGQRRLLFDLTYESEVKSIKEFLEMQHPSIVQSPVVTFTFSIWIGYRILFCGRIKVVAKYVGFFMMSDGPFQSVFFSKGTGCDRTIFLVVCQSELSVEEMERILLAKFSDLIEARSLLSLLVKLLSFRLSEGYLVLCQVAWALRFSDIRTLICRERFLALWVR